MKYIRYSILFIQFYFCFAFMFITNIGYSQNTSNYLQNNTNNTALIPLSPEASALFKWTSMPVSPMTGQPSISFPLFNIKSGSLSIPISLNYQASGIQVSQQATRVGLGWSLSAGGSISRMMRGQPDETSSMGYENDPLNLDTAWSRLYGVRNSDDYNKAGFISDGLHYDLHPDIYYFSFPSLSGKFIYSKDEHKFVSFPFTPIKIERENGFKIVDSKGVRYFFGVSGTISNGGSIPKVNYIQNWNLTKIVSANGMDSILFIYDNLIIADLATTTESITYSANPNTGVFSPGYIGDNYTVNSANAQQKQQYFYRNEFQLKEIDFNGGKLMLYANTARQDFEGNSLDSLTLFSSNSSGFNRIYSYNLLHDYFPRVNVTGNTISSYYRLRLASLIKKGVNEGDTETISFEYDSTPLPNKQSFSVDYWGYYNGAGNTGLLPNAKIYDANFTGGVTQIGYAKRDANSTYVQAGILKKVTYPTGGYTIFNFESNKYVTQQTATYVHSGGASVSVVGGANLGLKSNYAEFTVSNDPSIGQVNVNITFNPHNPTTSNYVILFDNTSNSQVMRWNASGDNSTINTVSDFLVNGVKSGHTYRLTAYTTDRSPNKYTWDKVQIITDVNITATVSYSYSTQNTSESEITGSGIRIKDLLSYSAKDMLVSHDSYSYGKGRFLSSDAYYDKNSINQTYQYIEPIDLGYRVKYTGNMRTYIATNSYQSLAFNGSAVMYDSVTKFSLDVNNLPNGKIEYRYWIPDDYMQLRDFSSPGGVALVDNTIFEITPTSENSYSYNRLTNQYSLIKSITYGYKKYIKNINIRGLSAWKNVVFFPATYIPSTMTSGVQYYGAGDYTIRLGGLRLVEKNVIDYINVNLNQKNNYVYDSDNLLLKENTLIDSKGDNYNISFTYPQDFSISETHSFQNGMMQQNMLDYPIQTFIKKAKESSLSLIHQKINNYKRVNKGYMLDNIQLQWKENPLYIANKFNYYDSYGNIQEQQKAGDVKEVYLWGYNGQYPVAKIVGSEYEKVNGVVTQSQIESNIFDENNLRSLLNNLRTNAATKNAQVWTYTYKPLVGMTSETDPKGYTTFYEYDGFGRLQFAKDKDNNIVKSYNYHYTGDVLNNDNNSPTVYHNVEKSSQPIARSNCSSGETPTSVIYTVPAGKYSSTISIEDANKKADDDILSNGQSYANTNASCISPYVNAYLKFISPNGDNSAIIVEFRRGNDLVNVNTTIQVMDEIYNDLSGETTRKYYSFPCSGSSQTIFTSAPLIEHVFQAGVTATLSHTYSIISENPFKQ